MRASLFGHFLMALVVVFGALAAEAGISKKLENPVGYDSLDKAAFAALMDVRSQRFSSRYEYGGCLYRANGLYYYTTPATDREPGEFSASCQLVTTDLLVGFFHNHPRGSHAGFSGGDVNTANHFKVTSYISINENSVQEVVRFVPGRTNIECNVFRDGQVSPEDLCARGDLVSKF